MPDIGDIRTATLTVSTSGVDTAAVLTVYKPDGTTPTPTVAGAGTGTLTAPVTYDLAGWYRLKWVVTGTGAGTEWEEVFVPQDPSAPQMVYASVEELRAQFGDTAANLDEGLLQRALKATSRAIDEFTGRRFWQDTAVVARTYRPRFSDRADVDDISTSVGLIVAVDDGLDGSFGATWAIGSNFVLHPSNAAADGRAYSQIRLLSGTVWPVSDGRDTLQVTAKFGWPRIPDQVNEACILRAAALFKRTDSPNGIAGFDGFGAVRISRQMDPDVADLLGPFCRTEALMA